MASNLLLSSSSKSSKLTSNEKANMVDLLVKCGTEIKNQSVAALGSFCNKYESSSTSIPPLLPAAPEMPSSPAAAPLSTETPCRLKSAVSSLCRSLPSASGFSGSSSSSSFQFIDPSELMRSLYEITKRPFLILLDCRPRTEFNNQHIKDSVHLNCRDKLIKKRLQMQKITIRDLISCELTKSKLDSALETTNNTTTTDIPTHDASSVITSNNESSETTASSSHFRVLTSSSSSFPLDLTSAFCSRSQLQHQQEQQQDNSEKENQQEANNCQQDATDENIIVIYDDTTSDDKDLLVESNPLKIVQENIRKAGIRKECKILKGGFKQFAAMCPDLCRSELKKSNLCNPSSYYYEQLQDQHQSMIDNTQMTEITPYLYLGNEMDAKNVSRLAQNGIYYILNVTKNIPFYDLPSSITADTAACDGVESSNSNNNTNKNASASKFVFKRIAVNDSINQSLKEYFDETFEFIEEARRKNAKVLVHCQAGVSRSPTIVIAYLMRLLGISMSDAYNRVRELRPIVAPNIVFWSQLTDYEVKLKAQQFSHRFTNCASHNNLANSLDEVTNPSEKNSSTEANKSAIECN